MKEKFEKIINYVGLGGMLHILCSVIVVSVVNLFFPLWVAIIVAALAGAGKEFIWDKWLGRGTFEKKDLICDLIGIVIGCL